MNEEKMNEMPTDEAPVVDTPVVDTPVDDEPTEDTPVVDTPVDDKPTDDTPVVDTPVDDTPTEDTPVVDTPVDDTPATGTPVDDTPTDDTPAPKTYHSPLVSAHALVKDYGTVKALKGIGINIGKGKIIGLLGPNGSGKTTLIKILAGLLTPTSGTVAIDGMAPGLETKSIVSYLPERTYFNSWMKVSDCLDYFQDFYADFDRTRAEAMLADLGVPTDRKLKTLSKGTKEKVQLVMVMARNAKLYLLDEPIAGVDPAAREYILNTIVSNYRETATVIVSTHLIADIESIIDSYVFIKDGNIIECRDIDELKSAGVESLDAYFREVFKYV